jgi:hypothetical protein
MHGCLTDRYDYLFLYANCELEYVIKNETISGHLKFSEF